MVFKVHKKSSGKQALSPIISTVIMTGAMIAVLSVALVFANNLLWSRVAEGEFDSSRQFMQSVGLQIDDVAWTAGRTETITYASQYGEVMFESSALTYNVTVNGVSEQYETGALMFSIPTSRYSMAANYTENIFPDQTENLVLTGTSAPVARVFIVENVPLVTGNYLRVVVVPTIRVLYSTITTGVGTPTNYIRMYLPVLSSGSSPRLSQSITLKGESLNAVTIPDISSITVDVSCESESVFDFAFSELFAFYGSEESVSVPTEGDVVLELYLSEVSVGFGF